MEKAYDRPREILLWIMEKKKEYILHVWEGSHIVQDQYEGMVRGQVPYDSGFSLGISFEFVSIYISYRWANFSYPRSCP